jgi:hypothetical protein
MPFEIWAEFRLRRIISRMRADYPVKAVWAAAHNPPIHTKTLSTSEALKGLERLGFLLVGKRAGALH